MLLFTESMLFVLDAMLQALDKSCQLANEAWEAQEPLSPQLLAYAATDAYAQLLLFRCMWAKLRELRQQHKQQRTG